MAETKKECQSNAEPEGFETWDAGGSDSYFYIQASEFARILYRDFGPGAAYFLGGHLVARQFRIPKRLLGFLIKQYQFHLSEEIRLRKRPIDFKTLTAGANDEFHTGAKFHSRSVNSPVAGSIG